MDEQNLVTLRLGWDLGTFVYVNHEILRSLPSCFTVGTTLTILLSSKDNSHINDAGKSHKIDELNKFLDQRIK